MKISLPWLNSFFRRVRKIAKQGPLASSRLSVILPGSEWKGFRETWYSSTFRKSVDTIQVSLKSDKNNEYFTWRPIYILIISHSILLIIRNISDIICRENRNIHFIFNNSLFFWKSCRLWDIVEKYSTTGEATDDNMVYGHCLLDKIRLQTQAKYAIFIAFPLQQWCHVRGSMLRYTYTASLGRDIVWFLP